MKTIQLPKLLIFIVAYQAESTIIGVLSRIPESIAHEFEVEVLIIDDSSSDTTFETSLSYVNNSAFFFKTTVLFNPVNQGYGGNQKIGYQYAIKNEYDFVALIHGDGQYAPECLPELLAPLRSAQAEAVFGTRMQEKGAALKGGMPLYKFIGNKILTGFENWILKINLSEFHSGYRLYSVSALKKIPFQLNSNDFHFDTEIIIQFIFAKHRIYEMPIPTYYGNEICRVNGIKYAWNVFLAATRARLQSAGLFYAPNFDCVHDDVQTYQSKLDFSSPHSQALKTISTGSKVLDLGCAGGYVGASLKKYKNCFVAGVDSEKLHAEVAMDLFYQHNLNEGMPQNIEAGSYDYILLLDVIEHLAAPERFVQELYLALQKNPNTLVIASTGNIGFFIPRLMLLFGKFNYGKRGILDMTHTRLFTFNSFIKLFTQNGFNVIASKGIPGPYPLAMGKNIWSQILLKINQACIHISRGLFSYQIFLVLQAKPSVDFLLEEAIRLSAVRKVELNSAN